MSKESNNIENYSDLQKKALKLESTLQKLSDELKCNDYYDRINFDDFLYLASIQPDKVFRDIFLYFYDMINYFVPEGEDDYKLSKDTVGFMSYDFVKLFVENCDYPFFADRLFANRFMNLVNSFSTGAQSNRIVLFEGPPGSGKSTFLKNLLEKLEAYANTSEGVMYKTYWRINLKILHEHSKLYSVLDPQSFQVSNNDDENGDADRFIEISCPSNDHPILQIPKKYRRKLLEDLIENQEIKDEILNSKEYQWIFKEDACHICRSIYNSLIERFNDPLHVLRMIYAKRVTYNKQFGKGISVFNPGDELLVHPISDKNVQKLVNLVFPNESIKYVHSNFAFTNNGVYALMDIKENNVQRLISLHGIISDGVHKVEHVEESIKSVFLGLVNPEDKKSYENVKSFQDRILHVNIPYILDYDAEVNVYRTKFDDIEDRFLPGVIKNFAKIIISSRMRKDCNTIKKWLKDVSIYSKYNDKNFMLLKMQLYKGMVPSWLSEEDLKNFTKSVRSEIIAESELEGISGISGRNSISYFNKLMSKMDDEKKLITMLDIKQFFIEDDELNKQIPEGFIDSIESMYDFDILQQIKESIYYYNRSQIKTEILNYLFALNYDIGNTLTNTYTGKSITVTEELMSNFESILLGANTDKNKFAEFRKDVQKELITMTLAVEMKLQGKKINETLQFQKLFEKYKRSIKENALVVYIDNPNFKRAIIDYDASAFKNYPEKLKSDTRRLLTNLEKKYLYSEKGAKQVCIYAIDKKIWEKFGK